MPTRMPDGGRDAIAVHPNRSVLVFQVKYARNPVAVKDAAGWVIKAIKPEIPKIERLLENGKVEQYVVVTNMPGSSHLNTGSIARVQKYLDENLTIPSQCWWRDELDRRLDNAFDLKLRYPDLMTGMDAFRLIWTLLGASEDRDRRENALRAYMRHHYEQDCKVKFKEVGLPPSPLFDLFIDVPISANRQQPRQPVVRGFAEATHRLARIRAEESDSEARINIEHYEDIDSTSGITYLRQGLYMSTAAGYKRINIGASELMLDPTFAERNPAIVLEGAPGQGKSTLSQYLVQIHRSRLLELQDAISALPKYAIDSPIMLPIKLELRDLALWLNGIDPWSAKQADMHRETPTLEAAIVAHIQRYSGGVQFSVADLLATLGSMPALIVLDALDEVADLDDRKRVVEEVKAAISRLRQRNNAVRFIITSRPTAIAKSPSFRSEKAIAYLSLAPINHELGISYAGRWARVRELDAKDTEELIEVLRRRLESPHIAELARNTMQLTILLNLISLRGPSLPDKRTDLYDTYFQVFMDRESEKDIAVRDNREFLVDLHTYLGYYLHAHAEANGSNGRITTSELEGLIQAYMTKQQQAPDRLPALTGAVDRIFAIVSRVEGTWEFEVQPLQEYFAARYLYDTAPYSPVGRERSGTKPDIFDGIASNSYWLNVTRFFAGCFSKGELLDLSDRLANLISLNTSYTRALAISLVQDWVFTQSTRATDAVLAAVFDKPGLRWASSFLTINDPGISQPIQLSFSRTNDAHAVVDLIWQAICDSPRTAGKLALCRLARVQQVPNYIHERWEAIRKAKSGQEKLEWLEVGGWLGLLEHVEANELSALTDSYDEDDRPAAAALIIANSGHTEALSEKLLQDSVKYILNEHLTFAPDTALNYLFSSDLWIWMIDGLTDVDRRYLLDPASQRIHQLNRWASKRTDLMSRHILEITVAADQLMASSGMGAAEKLSGWIRVIECFTLNYGQSLFANELGVMAGCFKAGRQAGRGGLFDSELSLVVRTRYAKSQLNRAAWWREQGSLIETDCDRNLWLLCLYAWASPDVIIELLGEVTEQLALMTEASRAVTVEAARRSSRYSSRSRAAFDSQHSAALQELQDPATICFLYSRIDRRIVSDLLLKHVEPAASSSYMGNVILDFVGKSLTASTISDQIALRLMARGYTLGADETCGLKLRSRRSRPLSGQLSRAVLEHSWDMPADVLMLAQAVIEDGLPNPEPVMRIAEHEGWFGADG
jgi:hypothetical protein